MNIENKPRTGWRQRVLHGIVEYWLIVLYMAVLFAVFTIYRRLILAHYQVSYEAYGISVIKAMILGKVVLVAEELRLGRGLEDKPLMVPTLYKSFLFTICVALFGVVETMIRSLIHGRGLTGAVEELVGQYTYEWLAEALVVFFTFIPFFAVRELNRVLGEGKISRLFFRRGEAAESDVHSASSGS
jgi:hypothetical protein